MSLFVTGATGYLGAYVCSELLATSSHRLTLLVRAKSAREEHEKLWRALQLHLSPEAFHAALGRIDVVRGDLTEPGLGLHDGHRAHVLETTDSILHIAASLNRRSEKVCLNTNVRGTLAVVKLARAIADARGGLRRFSHVSTVAVAGRRDREVVQEDSAIDWDRSDYDPYGRTKKLAEHLVRELLPDVPKTFFRPSIVMGDARRVETTQFDMVRAFCALVDLPIVPVRPDARLDIVNADWVARAITRLHLAPRTRHEIYHLSSGTHASRTASEIAQALVGETGRRPPRFVAQVEGPFARAVDALAALPRGSGAQHVGSLLKVFLPYVTYDTVFDSRRAIEELGEAPRPFTELAAPLYAWAKRVRFSYPYAPLPTRRASAEVHA